MEKYKCKHVGFFQLYQIHINYCTLNENTQLNIIVNQLMMGFLKFVLVHIWWIGIHFDCFGYFDWFHYFVYSVIEVIYSSMMIEI